MIIYIIEFLIGFGFILYSLWKSPGLFPFNFLLDSIISFSATLIMFGISFIISKIIAKIVKNVKSREEKIYFTIAFVIIYIIFINWMG